MDNFIVLAHIFIIAIFIIYLLVRFVISLFGLTNKEFQATIRGKLKVTDWAFTVIIGVTGIYPLIALGQFELYHLVKLTLLIGILWLSRYATKLNLTLATISSITLVIVAIVSSFKDKPTFPKEAGAFEANHPEISTMSEIEKGQFIFTSLCVECHGPDGKKGRFQAADLTASTLSLQQKIQTIRNGSPMTVMRSFETELSDDEIEAVAEYVHGLAD